MRLRLDVRIDGFPNPVGRLERNSEQGLSFNYAPEHLADPDAMAVSMSLPLRESPFGDVETRAFYDNLLAEQDGVLAAVMAREGLQRTDIAGLLYHLGKDCAGALSVLPEGAPPAKVPGRLDRDYRPLTDAQVAQIVQSLHQNRRLPAGAQDPSPLAGVQSKVAVTKLPDGGLAEPRPNTGAPTTHILKVPYRGHERDAAREAMALQLSVKLVPTAVASRVDYGGVPAILVERFDRKVRDGLVTRVHQEDFAQALGLPSAMKYERRGAGDRRFSAAAAARILDQTISPARARARFVSGTLFDLLIGNVDAHAKNHAIIHIGPGRYDLAPRYDLLPTRLDPELTDELAFRIGAATRLPEITESDFDGFLIVLGIATVSGRRRIKLDLGGQVAKVLSEAFNSIAQSGHKDFADLAAANMRTLLPVLGIEIPQAANDRDAAIIRGGGWLAS